MMTTVRMTTMLTGFMVVAVLLLGGCNRAEEPETRTETISAAVPPPGEVGGDETALTQTTEIGEDRSPNEGGALADPDTDSDQP